MFDVRYDPDVPGCLSLTLRVSNSQFYKENTSSGTAGVLIVLYGKASMGGYQTVTWLTI